MIFPVGSDLTGSSAGAALAIRTAANVQQGARRLGRPNGRIQQALAAEDTANRTTIATQHHDVRIRPTLATLNKVDPRQPMWQSCARNSTSANTFPYQNRDCGGMQVRIQSRLEIGKLGKQAILGIRART